MTIFISGLKKSFGATEVLRDIDLQIEKGELVALLGPSGSGKTTLLKIIAGLEWPDAGSLSVDGVNWLDKRAQDRRIGFVFQHYALFPHLTVRDNITFGLTVGPRARRPDAATIAARLGNLLELLQITHLADRYPAQLSGGQRQRVALGRALAIEPSVLLLDEPFGALDAAIRRDLRNWLREVHQATGSTSIFVTHDQEEAFELADRVVVMGQGRIEQTGSADQIHDHPASAFVAGFMGATIQLPVQMRAGRIEAEGLDASALERRVLPDGPATLYLRPEDITPVPDPAGPWRIASRNSTGTVLRLMLIGRDGQKVESLFPRRAIGADKLQPGVLTRLRPQAGAVFPLAGPATPVPLIAANHALPTRRAVNSPLS